MKQTMIITSISEMNRMAEKYKITAVYPCTGIAGEKIIKIEFETKKED